MLVIYHVFSYLEHIRDIGQENPGLALEKILQLLHIILILMALGSISFGIYVIHIAVRVLKTEQFPPPGVRVIRDTKVRTGRRARIIAMFFILFSVFIVVIGTVGSWYTYDRITKLTEKN